MPFKLLRPHCLNSKYLAEAKWCLTIQCWSKQLQSLFTYICSFAEMRLNLIVPCIWLQDRVKALSYSDISFLCLCPPATVLTASQLPVRSFTALAQLLTKAVIEGWMSVPPKEKRHFSDTFSTSTRTFLTSGTSTSIWHAAWGLWTSRMWDYWEADVVRGFMTFRLLTGFSNFNRDGDADD